MCVLCVQRVNYASRAPLNPFLKARAAAEAAAQSLRDFLVSFDPETYADVPLEDIDAALLARCSEVTRGFEPAGERELGIDIGRDTTANDVFTRACQLLGVAPQAGSK